jgi:hypothetical protein
VQHAWDLFDASPSGYDHFEVLGPVTLGAVPLTQSGYPDLFTLRLRFDPIDDVDIIRLVVNDGSDPTVLLNGGGFVIGNKVLQEGERFFLPRFNPGGPALPPQEFEVHYGLDSTDNDVRLVAVPEPASLLTLGTCMAIVLYRKHRRNAAGSELESRCRPIDASKMTLRKMSGVRPKMPGLGFTL